MTWEKEFDEEFAYLDKDTGYIFGEPIDKPKNLDSIKSFIQQEIDKTKEQGRWDGMKLGEQVIRKEFEDAEEMFTKRIQLEERKKVVEMIDELKCSPAMSDQIHCTCLQHLRDKLSY